MNKLLPKLLLGAVVIGGLVWLGVSYPSAPDVPTAVKGEKGDKGDRGLTGPQGPRGFQGPKGDQGEPSFGALTNPNLPHGYLTLGGGTGLLLEWAPLRQGTSSLAAIRPSDTGLTATSSLYDAWVRLPATTTAGAVITFSKITSAYTDGFSTSTTATHLGSTTIDLAPSKGPAYISLRSSTSSIFGDEDNSNFDPESKENFLNHWNPLTDRLLVTIDAKNVDKNEPAATTFNLDGAVGVEWRAIK